MTKSGSGNLVLAAQCIFLLSSYPITKHGSPNYLSDTIINPQIQEIRISPRIQIIP